MYGEVVRLRYRPRSRILSLDEWDQSMAESESSA